MNAAARAAVLAVVSALGGCAAMPGGAHGGHGAGMQGGPMQAHHGAMCSPEMHERMKAMHEKHAAGGQAGMHGQMQCPAAQHPQGGAHKH